MGNYIELHEERNLQSGKRDYGNLMTDEQKRRGEYYSNIYNIRRSEIDDKYKDDWDSLCEMYECKRTPISDDEFAPCNFVPLLTPTVEGQVASMMESDMDFRHITNNPAHEPYMPQLDAASEYNRRKTEHKATFKDFSRYYDLLGNAYVYCSWEKTRINKPSEPNGVAKVSTPSVMSIIVDGRIKDPKDLQYADYIIQEIGYVSVGWARDTYGDGYADSLLSGFNRQEGDDPDVSYDDTNTFMLLNVWTRNNKQGNLQKIEMDSEGLIFKESDPSKPYYKYIHNQYPFRMARMIPQLGRFYGIGDGAILKPMQETVNNLTDELETAARFSAQTRLLVDPKGEMDGDQLDSDPSHMVWCKDPHGNVLVVQGGGINPVVNNMIEFLLREAQKATRFNETMTGNKQGSSATATQINSQLVQGSVGIKDKKADIAEVMAWADMYCLGLCMEFWDKPFWVSLGQDYSVFVDAEAWDKIPASKPMTAETARKEIEKAKLAGSANIELPKYEDVYDENGIVYCNLDFDTKVIIGESIPKGRTDMYNILLGLAQMQVLGADGMPKPLITSDRLTQLMEELLGMKLKTISEENGEESGESMLNPALMNSLNPIGNNETVQTPTAANLQQTVPQMPNADSRKVQI